MEERTLMLVEVQKHLGGTDEGGGADGAGNQRFANGLGDNTATATTTNTEQSATFDIGDDDAFF